LQGQLVLEFGVAHQNERERRGGVHSKIHERPQGLQDGWRQPMAFVQHDDGQTPVLRRFGPQGLARRALCVERVIRNRQVQVIGQLAVE
jgi:hypothetical protein